MPDISTFRKRAIDIINVPAGDITATNVQSAIDELDTEKIPLTQKNAISGVAALDAFGDLLVPGRGLNLSAPAAPEDPRIVFNDQTFSDWFMYFERVGVGNWNGFINDNIIQHAGHKNIASGIAGLDASIKQVPAQHFVSVPAAANSSGIAGQMAYNATHFYICTATDTWLRVAIATW